VDECLHTRSIPDLRCKLNYISRQQDSHLQKSFRLLALVGVKSLTMPAIHSGLFSQLSASSGGIFYLTRTERWLKRYL